MTMPIMAVKLIDYGKCAIIVINQKVGVEDKKYALE